MPNVPKIVRERLRSATAAVNHPDADLLTAFAERSLPERDRGIVLEHLARCADCRDIVALALPATESQQTVLRPSSGGWLTWPALRWGLVAAGVVAIASFGVVQYRGRMRPEAVAAQKPTASQNQKNVEVASNEPTKRALDQFVASAPAEKRDKLGVPAAPAFADMPSKTNTTYAGKKSIARSETAPPASSLLPANGSTAGGVGAGAVRGAASFGPRVANNQWQQNATLNQAPAPPPPVAFAKQQPNQSANQQVPGTTETVEVSGAAPMISTEAQSVNPPLPSADQAMVARAKSPVAAGAANGASASGSVGGPLPASPVAAPNPPLVPLWTITSTGALQRSFDQGKTWQPVDVNASLVASNFANLDATSLKISASTSSTEAERKKAKDADKSIKRQVAAPVFRAVAASGSEVWAGGSWGLLCHSLDGGNHWTRIVPSAAGASLTGDILSIEFPDPQHGKLSTSTSETWITTDDGGTWQKQ